MFIAVTEDRRNSASDINFMCSVCSQRLFGAVSGVINISSYYLAADRIARMYARSVCFLLDCKQNLECFGKFREDFTS
jgi:hypothetical protein